MSTHPCIAVLLTEADRKKTIALAYPTVSLFQDKKSPVERHHREDHAGNSRHILADHDRLLGDNLLLWFTSGNRTSTVDGYESVDSILKCSFDAMPVARRRRRKGCPRLKLPKAQMEREHLGALTETGLCILRRNAGLLLSCPSHEHTRSRKEKYRGHGNLSVTWNRRRCIAGCGGMVGNQEAGRP